MGLQKLISLAVTLTVFSAATGRLPELINQVRKAQIKLIQESKASNWGPPHHRMLVVNAGGSQVRLLARRKMDHFASFLKTFFWVALILSLLSNPRRLTSFWVIGSSMIFLFSMETLNVLSVLASTRLKSVLSSTTAWAFPTSLWVYH